MRQPVDGLHLVTQQRKYLVTRGSDEAGTTTITDRTSKKVVVRHVPPTGFVAQSPVVIDDRWALIEDIRSEGPDPEIRVYRYDLTTGRPADLASNCPKVSEPEIGASDGTFAYSSTDATQPVLPDRRRARHAQVADRRAAWRIPGTSPIRWCRPTR